MNLKAECCFFRFQKGVLWLILQKIINKATHKPEVAKK